MEVTKELDSSKIFHWVIVIINHVDQNYQNNNDVDKKTAFTFIMTWATLTLEKSRNWM